MNDLLKQMRLVVCFWGLVSCIWAQEAESPFEKTFIEYIAIEEIEEEAVIKIQTNQRLRFVDFSLYKPPRLLIEVIGSNVYCKREAREIVNAHLLREIGIGYFRTEEVTDEDEKKVDFLVFTFNETFSFEHQQSDRELTLRIKGLGAIKEETPEMMEQMANENPELAAQMMEQAKQAEGESAPEGEEDSEERKKIKGLKEQDMEAEAAGSKARDKMNEDKEDIFGDIKAGKSALSDEDRVQDGESEAEGTGAEDISALEQKVEEDIKRIKQIREDQELTEMGFVIDKPNKGVLDILDAVTERRKDMLFFKKEQEMENEAKAQEIDFKSQMKGMASELKRYAPQIDPGLKEMGVDECIQVAINNHLPAQIALERVKLAKIKLWEARRNIFPKMTLDINKTKGESDALPFLEEDYKFTMDQTLYDGGEVKFLLDQARVNLEVAKRTYDKVKSELALEVEEAYFNLIMAKMNLGTQRRLLDQVEVITKKQELMLEKGLTRSLDFRNIKSSYNQVQFQLAGTVKDLAMGKLSLRQKMSIGNDISFNVMDTLGFKNIEMNVQDAIWLAYKYRPEYIVNKLMVDFQNFDRLANRAKESFRLDFSSRYGYGGSAYQSGILHLQEQWYTGLKVTKPFGGNTVEMNVIKEHAFPRLGQSSRGNTFTRSLKVSLLDNLKLFTDKKQADITFQEAVLEVGKMEKQIETDVRNAYYDYQKGIIQIDSAFDKVLFRQEELKVNTLMAQLGEGTIVQALDSHVRLADEKSFYYQGLVNYYVAIANMNKAIGLIGYYR